MVIFPTLAYAAQIWAFDQAEILELAQTHFLRKLLLIYPPRAANYFLRLEVGRKHTLYRILELAIKFNFKLCALQVTRIAKIMLNELIFLNNTKYINKESKTWVMTYAHLLN